jgi:hypothetical protein
LLGDPHQHVFRLGDHHARELFVGLAARDEQQVVPEFLFGVRAGECLCRGIMRTAHIARMPRVTAAVEFRRRLDHQHGRTALSRRDGRTQRRVAPADDEDIVNGGKNG